MRIAIQATARGRPTGDSPGKLAASMPRTRCATHNDWDFDAASHDFRCGEYSGPTDGDGGVPRGPGEPSRRPKYQKGETVHRRLLWLVFLLAAFSACEAGRAANVPTARPPLSVTERILYRFKGGADGAHPQGGVIMDQMGNLYGTTYGTMFSGANGCTECGTVFQIAHGAHAETILHAFSGGTADGAYPTAGLSIDRAGNLYGTTEFGGRGCTTNYLDGCGTVFEVSALSHTRCTILCGSHLEILSQRRTITILDSFSAQGGWAPDGGLIMDRKGDLYGTTTSGGCGNGTYGCGIVFEIAAGTRMMTVLHTFARGSDIDGFPRGRLILDHHGNLYGTTWTTNLRNHITGIVFEIMARSHEGKILHVFSGGRDGSTPNGGLAIDKRGDLYGTTQWGGGFCNMGSSPGIDAQGCGTVFEIRAGNHEETILYRFQGGRDGMDPRGGLVMDSAGNLYGTTSSGGIGCRFGCGTVFEIAASTHDKTTLYRFKGGRDGESPQGDLFIDNAGNLYGTTFQGGMHCQKETELGPGCGTVFEVTRK